MRISTLATAAITIGLLLPGLEQPAQAASKGFVLQRLPASVGKQVVNSNGQQQIFIPTSINNDGLLAGVRITWEQDATGHMQAVVGQQGYLYDLNTRSYVAEYIKDMAPTYVANGFYYAYGLNTSNWETYRCPISGLTADSQAGHYSNPSCVLVDSDGDPQKPVNAAAYAAYLYSATVFRSYSAQKGGNSSNGSAVIYRWNHPDSSSQDAVYYYYRENYPVLHADTATVDTATFLTDLLGRTTGTENVALLTSAAGQDDFVLNYPAADGSSGDVAEIRFPVDGSSAGMNIAWHHLASWLDSSGNPVTGFAVNDALDVLTFGGICNLNDIGTNGCTILEPVNFSELQQKLANLGGEVAGLTAQDFLKSQVRGFNRQRMTFTCLTPTEPASSCAGNLFTYRIAKDEVISFTDEVQQQFSETLAANEAAYTIPTLSATGTAPILISAPVLISPNQKYMVWVVKKSDGTLGRYSIIFGKPKQGGVCPATP